MSRHKGLHPSACLSYASSSLASRAVHGRTLILLILLYACYPSAAASNAAAPRLALGPGPKR